MSITYAVVTGIRSLEGNLGDSVDLYWTEQYGLIWSMQDLPEASPSLASMSVKTAVFYLGELLVLDDDNQEVGFPWRKPYKWEVDIQVFDQVEEAASLAQQVTQYYYDRGL